jgi:steroid 5-alpha reductase family enzyme
MPTLLFPVLATILCAIIDFLRIKFSYGKVENIDKFWTISIGVILFTVCLDLSFVYTDELSPLMVLVYLLYYLSVRLTFYSPLLNVLRGLDIFYRSTTTNSRIDQLLNKYNITPLAVMVIGFVLTFIFAFIWQTYIYQ